MLTLWDFDAYVLCANTYAFDAELPMQSVLKLMRVVVLLMHFTEFSCVCIIAKHNYTKYAVQITQQIEYKTSVVILHRGLEERDLECDGL